MSKIKVVHYINQFFAQIGGEEKADYPAEIRVGEVVGPGLALTQNFKDEAEIIATVICGDSYFNENLEKAKADILAMVKEQAPDVFIAGPAFNAGRYGVACGTIAAAVQEELGIPAVTGMYVENPGADMFKNDVYMISTKNSAAGMRDAVKKLAPLAVKLAKGEKIGSSAEEGYIPNGVRVNFFEKERGSKRAVKMLIKKLNDKPYVTEYPMPNFDRVEPNPAVKDLAHAKIALVTSGGIVPKGNPDHIESSSASHYGEYDITENENMGYYMPEGGTNQWSDAMVIPKNAKNPELAHAFINYASDYDGAYDNSSYVGYTSANKKVMKDLYDKGGEFEGIDAYIPRTDNKNDEVFEYNEETKKEISNLWSKVKIAASNTN